MTPCPYVFLARRAPPSTAQFYTPTLTAGEWTLLRQNIANATAFALGPRIMRLAFRNAVNGNAAAILLESANANDLALVNRLKAGLNGYISNSDVIAFAGAVSAQLMAPNG
ncbi:UNVERIFIED_CONTAM: hypothetical protein HDU68_011013, partial [Siphonaria sp. JEL0065]